MGVFSLLSRATTWWNRETLGTQLYTWRKGVKVGEDSAGNIFYRDKGDSRRWVIFNGEVEASRVSADWHGWLHRTWDEPPTEKPLPKNIDPLASLNVEAIAWISLSISNVSSISFGKFLRSLIFN